MTDGNLSSRWLGGRFIESVANREVHMAETEKIMDQWESQFEQGTSLSKCRHCGCMKGALEEVRSSLGATRGAGSEAILEKVETWLDRMETSLYT